MQLLTKVLCLSGEMTKTDRQADRQTDRQTENKERKSTRKKWDKEEINKE